MEANIWTKNYPKQVSPTIDMTQYENILDVFDESVRKFRNKSAFLSNFAMKSHTTSWISSLVNLRRTYKIHWALKRRPHRDPTS